MRIYRCLKANKKAYPAHLVAFAGYGCSFGAKWFGGYARGIGENGVSRNYCTESRKVLFEQGSLISGVWLFNTCYSKMYIPPKSLIYCDPPYKGTLGYACNRGFDHDHFWEWCRKMSKKGHTVFVSEYAAPPDFKIVWEREIKFAMMHNAKKATRVERLFTSPRARKPTALVVG